MNDQLKTICRMCNGTGKKIYYKPLINIEGFCPHCAGMIYLDWITNIKGVKIHVSKPQLSEGKRHDYETFQKYADKYGYEFMEDIVKKHKFWAFVFREEKKERKEKRKNWELEMGDDYVERVLESCERTSEGIRD